MREEQAFRWFYRARWPDGTPWCPHCGAEGAYTLTRHGRKLNRFKCRQRECRREFTVTSCTPFAHHKMSFRKMLAVILLFAQGLKGKAALEVCREVGLSYKAAWVFLMKIREAIAAERDGMQLDGIVEMDGAYVGGKLRPANRAVDRVDGRLRENAAPADRQVVTALRQRADVRSPDKTLAVVTPGELDTYVRDIVRRRVSRTAVMITDEHRAYQNLRMLNPHIRVNHQLEYAAGPGRNTNLVESFFSRLRRSELGTHHRISGTYLDFYAAGLAWQENHRKDSFKRRVLILLAQITQRGQSRSFCGYWQGNHPVDTIQWRIEEQ